MAGPLPQDLRRRLAQAVEAARRFAVRESAAIN
jgi:hypothetical protein